MKNLISLASFIILSIFILSPAFATYDITSIALGTSPSINNTGEIVWNVSGGVGVTQVVSNIRGQITSGSSYHTGPSINDAGEIVWSCCYHKQIESNIRGIISGNPVSAVHHPEINDIGEIVWQEYFNYSYYIMSNIRGEIASGTQVGHPSINNNGEIIWHEKVPSGEYWTDPFTGESYPIMYYQIMSNTRGQITSGNYDHSMPAINDNGEIVWVENWNERIVSNINGLVDEITGTGYVFDPDINDKGEIVYQKQIGQSLYVMKAIVPEPISSILLDIKPQACPNPLNVKSKGVLPVAVLGSEDFDVSTIDLESITLAGVAPIRSDVGDVSTPVLDKQDECDCTTEGEDGFDDLTLKFDIQEIVAALGEVTDGEELILTLTGELLDGTSLEGEDCVVVLSKGGKGKK